MKRNFDDVVSKWMVIIVTIMVVFLVGFNVARYYAQQYYIAVENMLDQIANEDSDYFYDVLMESQIYENYENAKSNCCMYKNNGTK